MSASQNVSASGVIKSKPGSVYGIFVSSASASPTIKVWDNPTAGSGRVLIDTFTPVAGQFYAFDVGGNTVSGVDATTGIYLSIGGTVSCTIVYN